MPQFSDHGVSYTASSDQSAPALFHVITRYLQSAADVPNYLTELLTNDPDMPMAWCLQGYLLKLAAHPRFGQQLAEIVSRLQQSASAANAREQQHIAALTAWVNDDKQALDLLEGILDDHPQDMLALRIAHYMHFYTGSGPAMAASTGRALERWSEDHPQYSYLLGMHAFGLEEAEDYALAEKVGRSALALNPDDLWSIHTVAHVLYMQDRHEEGKAWFTGNTQYLDGANNFRYHLHWHHALHHFALQQYDAVLEIYDKELDASTADDFYLDLCNNAALLWRLEHVGADVGLRWDKLEEIAANHTGDKELLFASLHYLLPLLRTGNKKANDFMNSLQEWASNPGDQASVAAKTGLKIAQAFQSGADSAMSDTELAPIGGSRAQRELFMMLPQH